MRLHDDEGSIAPLIPGLILALFLIGGLVIDGGRDLNARGDAQGYAEESARAGASAVNLQTTSLTLDETKAAAQVNQFCTDAKAADARIDTCGLDNPDFSDAVNCDGAETPLVVHTIVTMKISTTLLGIVGVTDLGATGRAKARPYEGTNADNAC